MRMRSFRSLVVLFLILAFGIFEGVVRAGEMPWVRVGDDKHGFVFAESGRRFVPWGFNYDHDDERPAARRLLGRRVAQGRERLRRR